MSGRDSKWPIFMHRRQHIHCNERVHNCMFFTWHVEKQYCSSFSERFSTWRYNTSETWRCPRALQCL
jgi:hypothetical protein